MTWQSVTPDLAAALVFAVVVIAAAIRSHSCERRGHDFECEGHPISYCRRCGDYFAD